MLNSRLAGLREDWPDSLRMVLSTVLAATVSTLLHLPEMYWAVLSAVIVSRPGAGGSAKAGASRLIGTVFGSAVAMGVLVARAWHVPEIALLAAAMIPLSLFITAFEEFRTAPVAAVILLSSGSALVSPFHVALLRLAQITIGSLASTVVGFSVLPSRGHGRVFRLAASLLGRIGLVLESAFDENRNDARLDAAHDDIRRDLRELGALVRTKVGGASRAQGRIARLLSRLQADSMFVSRIVGTGLRRVSASQYAHAIHGVCRDLADGLLDPESSALQRCADALGEASAAFAKVRRGAALAGDDVGAVARGAAGAVTGADPVEPPAIDALDFLLETFAKDLRDLIRVLQGPR
jgi:Fusaric acid resistance protein family